MYRREQNGYILLLVLWALVVLSIVAARTSALIDRAQIIAIEESEAVSADVDIRKTLSTLQYLISRQRGTIEGLPMANTQIKIDGTIYSGFGES